MKTKQDAIELIKKIQNGRGVERGRSLPLGSMAVSLVENEVFIYGMEYGVISGLMELFDITKEELI